MTDTPFKSIAIFGAGLAATLCAAILSQRLPEQIHLTFVETGAESATDIFYGTVTSPSAYDFLLKLGISEPDLFPGQQTSFSLGTRYENWGPEKRAWTQSFHQPLPLIGGVAFQHYLSRLRETSPQLAEIEPYIMSIQAARRGVFAHPPQGQKTPLTSVEYGYNFLPQTWRDLFYDRIDQGRVQLIKSEIATITQDKGGLSAVTLTNGETVKADLYIDARAQSAPKDFLENPAFNASRLLGAAEALHDTDKMQGVCRTLQAMSYGWAAETPLQKGRHRLSIFDLKSQDEALTFLGDNASTTVKATIGSLMAPWQNNVLALGHKAALLEPLSPAPMMLLQRDIERLAELIPVSPEFSVERREYNRRFAQDYSHAEDFHRSLFEGAEFDTPYGHAASAQDISDKLARKIIQFKSRGICIQYDLEPFQADDWRQQHLGLGRLPARYDTLADKVAELDLKNTLQNMRRANDAMAQKLPPHQVYMTGLVNYLRKKNG